MTALKRILTSGLVLSLMLPAAVFGEENKAGDKPIKDNTGTKIGTFSCVSSHTDWTKELELEASAVPDSGKSLPQADYVWEKDGKTDTERSNTYTVSENGSYKVSLEFPAGSGLTSENIELTVENIDTKGPEILNVTKSKEGWTSDSILLTFECEDYQDEAGQTAEDSAGETSADELGEKGEIKEAARKKGSGLHPDGAYSYDGGKTWTNENTLTVESNGDIAFVVRDALENETARTVTIDSIDKSEPVLRLSIGDGGVLYEGEDGTIILMASASDTGSGLADMAYSWDGGVSWNSSNTLQVSRPGNYTVYVRDRAGNFTRAGLNVAYAQRPADTANNGSAGGDSPNGGSGNAGGGNDSGSGSTGGSGNASGAGGEVYSPYPIYYGVPAADTINNNTGSNAGESRETRETESEETEASKETKAAKETKESEEEVIPIITGGDSSGSGFPLHWILIGAAAIALLGGGIAAAKVISGRRGLEVIADDEAASDNMEDVYARVSGAEPPSAEDSSVPYEEEPSPELTGVSEFEMAEKSEGQLISDIEKAMSDGPEDNLSGIGADTVDLGREVSAIAAAAVIKSADDADSESETEALAAVTENQEPVTEEIEPVTEEIEPVTENQEPVTEEPEAVTEEPEAVEKEAPSKSGTDRVKRLYPEQETVPEPKASPEEVSQEPPAEEHKVILEGEHSRLIYDPENGEYKYEFK